MKKVIVIIGVAAAILTVFSVMITCETVNDLLDTALSIQSADAQASQVKELSPDINNIPLYFIRNNGQLKLSDCNILYYARTSSYTLAMIPQGLAFLQNETEAAPSADPDGASLNRYPSMIFVRSESNPEMVPVGILQTHKNAPGEETASEQAGKSRRIHAVKTSKAIVYKNVYRNTDLKVYGVEKQVEYDWIINPGANPEDICFQYKNILESSVDGKGNLVIVTPFGELIHHAPVTYQIINGEKVPVPSSFKNYGNHVYGFDIQQYNKFFPLIIDPLIEFRSRDGRKN